MAKKYYVVWSGFDTGVFDSWEDAQEQVKGYPGARYKSFASQADAIAAYRNDPDNLAVFKAIAAHEPEAPAHICDRFPEIKRNAIAVDAACSKNPGPVEYRGVMVDSGQVVFSIGPLQGGSNNIGEYLALVHAAALLRQRGDFTTPIYSDSRTALAWARNRHSRTSITPNAGNARILDLLQRADRWMANNRIINPVLKWDTDRWGEIPADFGRK